MSAADAGKAMSAAVLDHAADWPRPRVVGVPVLYLDFDGVLHHEDVCVGSSRGVFFGADARAHGLASGHDHRLFEHAGLLLELMRPYPELRIVLSTTWVQWRGFTHARDRLPAELARRVVGATYHRRMDRYTFRQTSRGLQIWSDVVRRCPSNWLAIDDDVDGWPTWCAEQLVGSDEALGISEPGVRRMLVQKLEARFGAGGR